MDLEACHMRIFRLSTTIEGKRISFSTPLIYPLVVVKNNVNFTWDRVRKGTDCLLAMKGFMVGCILALSNLKEEGPQYHVVVVEFRKILTTFLHSVTVLF